MFTVLEEKQILKLNDQLSGDITISLVDSEHPQNKAFEEFCDNLSHLVSKVKIAKEEYSAEQLPGMIIGNGLRYQALPSGHELQPFLEALISRNSDSPALAEPIKNLLKKEKLPATLTLFIAPQCTFCPGVVRQLVPL